MRHARTLAVALSALLFLPAPALLALGEGPAASIVQLSSAPTDSNGNGKYESISVIASVDLSQAGDYDVRLALRAPDGSWRLSYNETASFAGGTPVVRYVIASFEGWKLYRLHVSGAVVAEAQVVDMASGAIVATAEQRGGTFACTDFEAPAVGAAVLGIGEPRGLDLDGDGLFDVLEVPVELRVGHEARYTVVLSGSGGGTTDPVSFTYSNSTELVLGDLALPVWVPGDEVRSVLDLTATVRLGTLASEPATRRVEGLEPSTFERPDLSHLFTGAHTETGVDPDSDGLFDQLSISLALKVSVAGRHRIAAYLAPPGDWLDRPLTADNVSRLISLVEDKTVARATLDLVLAPGPASADFLFDGRVIRSWGHDGPYSLLVIARGPASFLWGVLRVPQTVAFKASDFERAVPPLRFVDGSADAGVAGTVGSAFTALQVAFDVTVDRPGEFTVLGVLSDAAGREVASSRATVTLAAGAGELRVLFPAAQIHDAGVNGPLTAVVRVDAGGLAWNDTTLDRPMESTHTTGAYRSDQFAPPEVAPGPKEPVLEEDTDSVGVRTGIMAADMLREWPDIAVFVAPDEGHRVYLRVLFSRLLAYADANGDGAPQPGEVAYAADLEGYNWQMGPVSTSIDARLGRTVRFDLTTIVDLVESDPHAEAAGKPLATVDGFASITLSFRVASNDAYFSASNGIYQVLGGSEVKIDVRIDVLRPVEGVDSLALEQVLRDDRGRYTPHPVEADGAAGATAIGVRPFKESDGIEQIVDFSKDGTTPGFYSWVDTAEATLADGTELPVDVSAGYTLVGGVMTLYLSYPYDVDTVSLSHDPSLGIFDGALPPLSAWRGVLDPVLWAASALAAVAVAYALRGTRRGRRGDGDDLEGDLAEGGPARPAGDAPAGRDGPSAPRAASVQGHLVVEWAP
jgi:hypothetical protein